MLKEEVNCSVDSFLEIIIANILSNEAVPLAIYLSIAQKHCV